MVEDKDDSIITLCIFIILGSILFIEYTGLFFFPPKKKEERNKILWGRYPEKWKIVSKAGIVCSILFGGFLVWYFYEKLPEKPKYSQYKERIKIAILLLVGGALLWPYSLVQFTDERYRKVIQFLSLAVTAIGALYLLSLTIMSLDGEYEKEDIVALTGLSIIGGQTVINDFFLWQFGGPNGSA